MTPRHPYRAPRARTRAIPDPRPRRILTAMALSLSVLLMLSAMQSARAATWTLDSAASFVSFASIKAENIGEVHSFGALSGTVEEDGTATVTIDLASVSTGIDLRNERMREMLFHVSQFPVATVTATVPLNSLDGLAVGDSAVRDVTAQLSLAGESNDLAMPLMVTRLSDARVMVQPLQLLMVQADDYALGAGIAKLREVAGLDQISHAVPATFTLVFERNS